MRTIRVIQPIIFGILITFALIVGFARASTPLSIPDRPTDSVIFVDTNAPGTTHNGSSWATAFTSLQSALAVSSSGNEIWIADGVYYPDEGTGQVNNARNSSFFLSNGVSVYGGFAGYGISETLLTQRDWQNNVTVLSGDIDHETNLDTTDLNGVVTRTGNIKGNNAYHVLLVTDTIRLDGFYITAGNANGDPSNFNEAGGGICNLSWSNPTLTNLVFSGNYGFLGGGIYNHVGNPMITNVIFQGNSADAGGGMLNYINSSPNVKDAVFVGNSAIEYGGGIWNLGSDLTLINAIFSGNSSKENGGGITNETADSTLYNVTFSGNKAVDGGGIANLSSSNSTMINVIFWGNSASSSGSQIWNSGSTLDISFSDIQGSGGSDSWNASLGTNNGGNIDADPMFIRNPDPGADGKWNFMDDDYGDLHLKPGSPAYDTGTNTVCPDTDLDGNIRPISVRCDMGAYELDNQLLINKTSSDTNPEPGQIITFSVVIDSVGLDTTAGVIQDTLPGGLNFIGPITLEPANAGLVGTAPPILVSSLVISSGQQITATFPVSVSYGLAAGTQLVNTASISSTEVITPVQAIAKITVKNAPPDAVDDSGIHFTTDNDAVLWTPSVLINDIDPNGDNLNIDSFDTSGTTGTVTYLGYGSFSYDPNGQFDHLAPGEQATDTFTYNASDGNGGSDTAMVTITISAKIPPCQCLFLPQVKKED